MRERSLTHREAGDVLTMRRARLVAALEVGGILVLTETYRDGIGESDPPDHHARRLCRIAATHPASVGFEPQRTPNGGYFVWVERRYVDRLRAVGKPGESYGDVIVRLAEASEGGE